ncbi:MAG: hypothetical protein ACRC75_10905, partial [Olsenella sp.]
DAMTKQASVFPDIVKTRVYWEELGYTHEQVDGIMTAVQAASATDTITQMMQQAQQDQKAKPQEVGPVQNG